MHDVMAEVQRHGPGGPPDRLLERIADPSALGAAYRVVAANGNSAGPDGVTPQRFGEGLEARLEAIGRALCDGLWTPSPALRLSRAADPDRPLVVPSVADRVVQRATADAIGPRIEQRLHDASHAYRPRRSAQTAARAVAALLADGATHVARADVSKFFDRIDRGRLLKALGVLVADVRVLELVRRMLGAGLLDGMRLYDTETGVAQGSPLSPLLSNLYLDGFDREVSGAHECSLVRYCDDFVLLGPSEAAVRRALDHAQQALSSRALALNERKTWVGAVSDGFVFVGFTFGPDGIGVPAAALDGLAQRLGAAAPADRAAIVRGFGAFYGPLTEGARPLIERLAVEGRHDLADCLREAVQRPAEPNLSGGESPTSFALRDRERRAAVRFASTLDRSALDAFVAAFSGRENCHAREMHDPRGHRRFVRRDGPLTAEIVQRHAGGREVVGAFACRADATVRWLCVDVDVSRTVLREEDEGVRADLLDLAHADAFAVARALRGLGAEPIVEDSGRKGRHVWVRFERPVPARRALALAFAACDLAGPPPDGLRRETFPDRARPRPGSEGPLVKLPWGLHGRTGRRCLFVGEDGAPLPDQAGALLAWLVTPIAALDAAEQTSAGVLRDAAREPDARTPSGPPPAPTGAAAQATPRPEVALDALPLTDRVLKACGVLGYLAAQVEATRYLTHRERLLALMTLGYLGPEGPSAVHGLMRLTLNYREAVTERYLRTLTGSPISCGRIRERYPEITRQVPCDCTFRLPKGAYPAPILHALQASKVPAFSDAARKEAERRRAQRAAKAAPEPTTEPTTGLADKPAQAREPVATPDVYPRAEVATVHVAFVAPSEPALADAACGGADARHASDVDAALDAFVRAAGALRAARETLEALFARGGDAPLRCSTGLLHRHVEAGRARYTIAVDDGFAALRNDAPSCDNAADGSTEATKAGAP